MFWASLVHNKWGVRTEEEQVNHHEFVLYSSIFLLLSSSEWCKTRVNLVFFPNSCVIIFQVNFKPQNQNCPCLRFMCLSIVHWDCAIRHYVMEVDQKNLYINYDGLIIG